MAKYNTLISAIKQVIKNNDNQEITGQILQDVLTSIVSTIGGNYTFVGVATPKTNPGTPDQNVFYLTSEDGTYSNFGGVALKGVNVLKWNGSWTSEHLLDSIVDLENKVTQIDLKVGNFTQDGKSADFEKLAINGYDVEERIQNVADVASLAVSGAASAEAKVDGLGTKCNEKGFFVVDKEKHIGMQYTQQEGLDAAKVAGHFLSLLISSGLVVQAVNIADTSITMDKLAQDVKNELSKSGKVDFVMETVEDGFFFVDSNLNIGVKIDNQGIHAPNLLEYEIVEQ